MRLLAALLTLTLLATNAAAQNDMKHFITRSGDKLMEGQQEYRFISFNIPNLHVVEDNMSFDATNEWRFPNEFEITDALMSVKQMGGRVTRTYVLSICRKEGPNPIPCHVKRPGEFNEEAFRALDRVLEVAGRVGVRVIIPDGGVIDWIAIALGVVTFIGLVKWKWDVMGVVIGGGFCGLMLHFLRG